MLAPVSSSPATFTALVTLLSHSNSLLLSSPVDFVLKDPRKKLETVQEPEELHRKELLQVPKPWVKSVQAAYQAMEQGLLVTNPTMGAVLNLWYREYRSVCVPSVVLPGREI